MRKLLLTTAFFAIFLSMLMAQIPQAFKYQAVVRDNNGMVLSDQNINLRISILFENSSGNTVYSETHPATTNGMGLVNLEIGRGFSPTGNISEIKWAEGDYFVKIEMDEHGGSDFKPMGVAQLLSVPYALHSGTATGISGDVTDGVPANNWILFGNRNTDPEEDKLGTTDAADLVVVTDDIERMRILSDGDVEIVRSLNIGENLTVERNVNLNTTSGATINNGPFTVANLSPTLLSGILTVDLHTDLNSSLNVDGVTDLNSAFNVNNASPSLLTGTLLVNENATFNQHVTLDNADLNATSPITGGLVVAGGVGIGKDLWVGGSAYFDGPLAVLDETESTSTTTGALTVAGGVGIAKRLNVGGATKIENTLGVNGQVTISANPGTHSESNFGDYPLQVEGGEQGIAIKVNGSRGNSNNYISFWDKSSGEKMWGRIEGETSGELASNPEFIVQNVIYAAEIIIAVSGVAEAVIDVASASTSSTACVGLGACVTTPVPSLIVGAIAKAVIEGLSLVVAIGEPIAYNAFAFANIGVTYQSGAGDYAEWLLKENPNELYQAGEIVGVKHGKISRRTTDAEKIMVISYNPIVLGNMPEEGKESDYEKVAFMGQVPVKVGGQVHPGDYILASGGNNGFGRAVPPDELKMEDYSDIVGIAWSGSITGQLGVVNVAVGLNSNDLAKVVAEQENEIQELRDQVNRTNAILAQLYPEHKDSFSTLGNRSEDMVSYESNPIVEQSSDASDADVDKQKVIYHEVTREQINEGFELAKNVLIERGIDIESHPFFVKVKTEPGFKDEFINKLQSSVNKAILNKQMIDNKSGAQTEIW